MSATYVQIDELEERLRVLEEAAESLPMERRAMYRKIGDELLTALRCRIGGAGKVQSWQERYVGSGGGYAAVRPAARRYTREGDGVGYVTNAIENGHRQQKGRYVPAMGKALARDRAGGKLYYAQTRSNAARLAMAAAEELLRDLERRLSP